jgi:hypothetical protein
VDIGDGQTAPLSAVTEAFRQHRNLRLDDPQTADFIQTVSLALREDPAAIAKLQQMQAEIEGAPPASPAPATPAVPAPSGAQPATASPGPAPAAPAPGAGDGLIGAIRSMLEPFNQRLAHSESFIAEAQETRELAGLKGYFEQHKDQVPNLAANEQSARRVLDRWRTAQQAGGPKPDVRDLAAIMREEEAYLAGNAPKPAAEPGPQVVRTDQPEGRIPGRSIPGREPVQPAGVAVATTAPVSTTVPAAGTPSPAVAEPRKAEGEMTSKSLRQDIEGQVAALGINR